MTDAAILINHEQRIILLEQQLAHLTRKVEELTKDDQDEADV